MFQKKLFNLYAKSPFLTKLYKQTFIGSILKIFVNLPYYIKYKFKSIIEYLSIIPRAIGVEDKRFMPLKELKQKYAGKRVFVTCTGPSLTIEDLELLKNEYVFGMNSIAKIHALTDWKPDFYAIQDVKVYKAISKELHNTDNGLVFAPLYFKKRLFAPSNWIYWPMLSSYHLYEMYRTHKYFARFSNDCYVKVYDGYTITYSILQLAIYMGFTEIYLLGCDCSYLGDKQHFIESGHYDPTYKEAANRMLVAYGEAKNKADNMGIKIYNATRGGELEVFPRVKLEDVLAVNINNKVS